MQEETDRTVWIAWGIGVLGVAASLLLAGVGSPYWAWGLFALGFVLVLRGHFPDLFGARITPLEIPPSPTEDALREISRDPELVLLDEAIAALEFCRSFQRAGKERYQQVVRELQARNSPPNQSYENWVKQNWHDGEMRLYHQVYKETFLRIRQRLAEKVPSAMEPTVDYDNPGNTAAVKEVCYDLNNLVEAYRQKLISEGKTAVTAPVVPRYPKPDL